MTRKKAIGHSYAPWQNTDSYTVDAVRRCKQFTPAAKSQVNESFTPSLQFLDAGHAPTLRRTQEKTMFYSRRCYL